MTPANEQRPERKPEALPMSLVGDKTSVLADSTVLSELDALAAHVDGAFVVVVRITGERYRRRCYLTAKAAESAARKATSRGESATVYMAELKPLWRLAGVE